MAFNQFSPIEVSVVMPCLNEAETIGTCVKKSLQALKQNRLCGEVIVVDNGSTDNSAKIAQKLGAKVVYQQKRGYGSGGLRSKLLSEANISRRFCRR